MFSIFFIRRPVFACVISIVIVILGALALASLPVARYPSIEPPTVQVSATYPGANAATVADTVAAPIEQEVNGVEGMIYMNSVSSNDGSYRLTVTFDKSVDLDMATVFVQNRVAIAESKLPEEVKRQGVQTRKRSPQSVLYLSFYSPDGTYDDQFLSNYVNLRVKDELARVDGVGEVQVFGVGQYSMRIWLDPNRLRSLALTASDVVNAIRDQNLQVAGGRVGAPPTPSGTANEFVVNVRGRLVEVEEFENIVVHITDDGRIVRIRDVAEVELGSDLYNFFSTFEGEASTTVSIYQIPGSNLIEVAEGVKSKLRELEAAFPPGLESAIVYDNTEIVNASIDEVVETLFITLVLVILTVYIFLQNFRATLIPSVTIPVSLIGTFFVMSMLGFSINQLTLFGLVLVIGIVVDDAIVVVENCTTWLDKGLEPKAAAEEAMKEVAGPVIATTLVLLSVFVPCIFIPGIKGTLFQQFAVTISVATIFSSLNALTLSPALCGILLRKNKEPKGLFRIFNRSLERANSANQTLVRLALKGAVLALIVFGGLCYVALQGLNALPGGFVPQEDEGYCLVSVQLPDGASLNRTRKTFEQINAIVENTPGIRTYMSVGGYSILDGAAASNAGFAVASFENWSERTAPEESQEAIIAHLNRALSQVDGAISFAIPAPSLPGVGLSGGFTYMLQDRGGAGFSMMETVAAEMIQDANAQSSLGGVRTTFRSNVPQLFVDLNRDQISKTGTSMRAVFDTISVFFGSAYVNDFTLFGRVFKVYAQAGATFRDDIRDLNRIELRTASGGMMPIGSVATIREVFGPQTITRFNLYPAVKILGQAAPGFSSGQAIEIMEDMSTKKLPNSMGYNWSELSYQEKVASGGTAFIYLFAVVMVYLVLAAQYESWSVPLSVCFAVPTALLGATAGAYLRGLDNNIYTQIGIILLIGLATKSAILITEFAKVRRESGESIFDAALNASKLRFRAVLMTAFSFILGVIPLLVASGAGAASRQVLGTVVFFGMIVTTALSLSIVPMFYFLIQKTVERDWGSTEANTAPSPEA